MPSCKHPSVKSSISKHIQKCLNDNNIFKLQFGKIFHISHTTVNRWINELYVLELELFSSLCELLNVTIYEFIGV